MMGKSKPNFITTFEAAYRLGFTPDYIRRLIAKGKIKGEKVGNNWIIKPGQLAKIARRRFPRIKENASHGSS